jgi:hypothetical protein
MRTRSSRPLFAAAIIEDKTATTKTATTKTAKATKPKAKATPKSKCK